MSEAGAANTGFSFFKPSILYLNHTFKAISPISGKIVRFFVDAMLTRDYIVSMKTKDKKTEMLSLRIEQDLFRRFDKLCMDTERSRGYHVAKALEAYLKGQK